MPLMPDRPRPTVRPESPPDEPVIAEIHRLAFGREAPADLVAAIRQSNGFIPELSLVALRDNTIVGHIMLSQISIQTEGGTLPAVALAPIAVHPTRQRQRIGSALILAALDRALQLGHAVVVVMGHSDYFGRFGFMSARAMGLEAPFDVPDDEFLVLGLRPGALDEATGMVTYPPAFAGHADR